VASCPPGGSWCSGYYNYCSRRNPRGTVAGNYPNQSRIKEVAPSRFVSEPEGMARGWESKAIESQQESVLERPQRKIPGLTPAQMQQDTKRDSLELQRKRVTRELEACRNDRVRKTLEDGLAYLNGQLAVLATVPEN
jgi:hypothetical protein